VTLQITQEALDLADKIETLPMGGARRKLIAISGPPGSGKSTLAQSVVSELQRRDLGAVVMPMDGFHLDDRILTARGLLPRKGAPETFDFGGFVTAIGRVCSEEYVILPVFDRSREIAIAGAEEITLKTTIVVVEGNYLCLDEAPWRDLNSFWDYSVFLDVPLVELERRLVQRWLDKGFGSEAARGKAQGNDIPNALRVIAAVYSVDETVRFDG
jgi:fructokinase